MKALILVLALAISPMVGAWEPLKKRCPVCFREHILMDMAHYEDPVYGGKDSWVRFKCFYGTFATYNGPCEGGLGDSSCYIKGFASHYYSEYKPTIRLAIEQWNYEVSPKPLPPVIKWRM